MSDRAVAAVLRMMREDDDPRLPQYIVYLHQPKGWTLRQIGDEMGVTREWVRVLELRGLRQIAEQERMDISSLPTFTPAARRARAGPTTIPKATVDLLAMLNEHAMRYRRGKDDKPVRIFNQTVVELLDSGVPLAEIARAIGQKDHSLRRRMIRWGIQPGDWRQTKARQRLAVEQEEKEQPTTSMPCKWPDCPSHTGGRCIH